MATLPIEISTPHLDSLCRKWQVRELSLFGSVLRSDFNSESDIDVLVTFFPEAPWSLWDLVDMRTDFKDLFGRDIDLVEERSLTNPYRRASILRSKKVIYAA